MLNFLQIRNYAIVESLELEFTGGFTCVTGETGAGKSILVDALGLLCGKRADISSIRSGADKAELIAEFEIPANGPASDWLEDAELGNGDTCLLRRVISENGRSRAWINGTAVTLQQLDSLGERLVEIHGQNEHMLLLRKEEQFRLLDGNADYTEELEQVKTRQLAWSALEQQKQALLSETPLDAGDMDLMRYQIHELESSMIPAEQFSAMEAEHRMLAHGGDIVQALDECLQSLEAERTGTGPALHRAVTRLGPHASLDRDIASAVELLREAAINCDEAHNSIQSALSRLDLSPERLAELEHRLNVQHDLARKHRVEPEKLQLVLDQMKARFESAGSLEARLDRLEAELATALEHYREAAEKLHSRRKSRAKDLEAAVTALMQELGMKGGQFELEVRHEKNATPSLRGSDQLELRVSANAGVPPGLLRKVASGGELSRISLAIKVASKPGATAPTQIFDEVDAGIGGDTANAVGALLKSLSANGQALCVTHLAQVAACADQQVQVQKKSEASGTRVETTLLDDNGRVDEIARMLGGRLSEQSRAHASELLAIAATRH
jgi:DNA repair protein RecN (Recombination protein N)